MNFKYAYFACFLGGNPFKYFCDCIYFITRHINVIFHKVLLLFSKKPLTIEKESSLTHLCFHVKQEAESCLSVHFVIKTECSK